MALEVHIKSLGIRGARRARVQFRGVQYYTHTLTVEEAEHNDDIDEKLEWLLASRLGQEEVIFVNVFGGRSWRSTNPIGRLQLSLGTVVTDPCRRHRFSIQLVGDDYKLLQQSVIIELEYTPPEMCAAFLGPENFSEDEVQPSEDESEPFRLSDAGEDEDLLEGVRKNIDRLEKGLATTQQENQLLNSPSRAASKKSSDSKRTSTLKTVRNLMRLVKRRSSGGSSNADEEKGIVNIEIQPAAMAVVAGTSKEDGSPEVRSVVSFTDETPAKRAIPNMHTVSQSHLRAQDFQVCLTILEARQLAGLNMDPVVCIQVGDQKKYTSVKESTNCPYYNEYFVFDFHMPPIMLFDKIINLSVLQARNVFRPNKMLGSFKLDVGTAWAQPAHQFYHKWAVLTDPTDPATGPKGYLKCDISVIGKGDTVNIPPKCEKDEDDIEANLLLPEGIPTERQNARFVIRIHKADGLPKMNLSIISNMKKALTGEDRDQVDPFVQICFAGLTGDTSVQKNTYNPTWNEQVVFTDMFPPLCQRMRIQLRDYDPMKPTVIGTHYIDLKSISNDGERAGFLPTFGPAYVYLYGSPRDYSLLDQHAALNAGLGEGVSYRARLLLSVRTEVADNLEAISSAVEVEPCQPPPESCIAPEEEYLLFGSIIDATMVDKKFCEKPISFELSIGNYGNVIDGYNQSSRSNSSSCDSGHGESMTPPIKATSHDKMHYYLPYNEKKPCMHVTSFWPEYTHRMYTSNMLEHLYENLEEGLRQTSEAAIDDAVRILRATLVELHEGCSRFLELRRGVKQGKYSTELDRRRAELCLLEMTTMSAKSRHLKAIVTKCSFKERYKKAQEFQSKLKFLIEDPQGSLPDVVVWAVSGGKRLAYQRVPARFLVYSTVLEETGKLCGKPHTMFLKVSPTNLFDTAIDLWARDPYCGTALPGKKADGAAGWSIPTQLLLYIWLGAKKDKEHFPDGLPGGFQINREIRCANQPEVPPPSLITYVEQHAFQLRAYIYQARSLIGSDASGLSDPFARIIVGEYCKTTRVIDETLSPTWDQSFIFNEIVIYGSMDQILKDPPIIIIEIFDQDQVGKSEFIGRAMAKPRVKCLEDPYVKPNFPPALEWYEITRGLNHAGELLATFELLEIQYGAAGEPCQPPGVPDLPPPLEGEDIIPIPDVIRPTLAFYRIEVLFWGLRDLKRIHLLTVDKPRVDVECAGHILYSSIIQNASKNPNFGCSVKYLDVELPEQELYRPPLTIRVVDCRSFGRYTLVGTHTINSIHKYMQMFPSAHEREADERRRVAQRRQELEANLIELAPDPRHHVETERENCPLLFKETSLIYGTNSANKRALNKPEENKKTKQPAIDDHDDEESSKDWWTKYFASVDLMIEEAKQDASKGKSNSLSVYPDAECNAPSTSKSEKKKDGGGEAKNSKFKSAANAAKMTAKFSPMNEKKKSIPKSALSKIYGGELESQKEYEEFKEWLLTFDLYRGKKSEEEMEDENRIVGSFKGAIKVYKLPLNLTPEDKAVLGYDPSLGVFQNMPSNEPLRVLVRVYIIKANDLHPMDLNGKADPYIVLQLGSKRISDKDNYISKQLNPVFGKCFEVEATFPRDSLLTVKIQDWDLVGSDDVIGETRIDLENRFYSRHRATCGLPKQYEEEGYNRWRDAMKPTQILAKLCKDGRVESPSYEYGQVRIGKKVFEFEDDYDTWMAIGIKHKEIEEKLALNVLHKWHEMPRIGCHLVPEHIETRPLYNPDKPGIERGKLEMWVDMFPMDLPLPGPPIDISPRKPRSYELRIIIWNTDDVVLEDDAFFTGEKMSDIYVKGWLKGPEDCQSTDIHYRSLTGEGNFNWRFIYPFDYLVAEEKIVISRKESLFSWDETESKIPARLEFQVWDADHFSADDFLGAITLDLNRFPRGAKSSKLCTLDMLKMDGSVPMVNIFKQKRVKGWWPFYIKKDNDELELTGKVEAEIHLLTKEEAEKNPAGVGRNEPDPLDRPNRPDGSFMWFLNPLKSIRYIIWHNYKWKVLKALFLFGITVLVLLFFYAIPGYSVKRILGA